jgi:hypothetical protein
MTRQPSNKTNGSAITENEFKPATTFATVVEDGFNRRVPLHANSTCTFIVKPEGATLTRGGSTESFRSDVFAGNKRCVVSDGQTSLTIVPGTTTVHIDADGMIRKPGG